MLGARKFTASIEWCIAAQQRRRPSERAILLAYGIDGFCCSMDNFDRWIASLSVDVEYMQIACIKKVTFNDNYLQTVVQPQQYGSKAAMWHLDSTDIRSGNLAWVVLADIWLIIQSQKDQKQGFSIGQDRHAPLLDDTALE